MVLSRPLLPPLLANFTPVYEGELMLLAQASSSELRVLRPQPLPEPGAGADGPLLQGWDVLANASVMATLNKYLPAADVALKVDRLDGPAVSLAGPRERGTQVSARAGVCAATNFSRGAWSTVAWRGG